jgi:hypothetical protein
MKIITDFKDFYDYGMAFGVDEGLVYERFQKKTYPPKHIENRSGGIIGFCGEFYELIKVYANEDKRPWGSRNFSLDNKEKVEEYIADGWVPATEVMSQYDDTELEYQYFIRKLDLDTIEWGHSWYKKDYSFWKNWVKGLFDEHKVPSFFVGYDREYETILNPCLKDYGLQKLMDPVEAFQKVSTFLPGLQPTEDFEMSDEQLGKSKGFDEYSFRNKNTKKKPKKF